MAEVISLPSWLLAKTGEPITQAFSDWIAQTQRKLLKAFPPAERAFCRIVDKMRSRLPRCCASPLQYTRQKYFKVAPSVVFFGDFYFRNARLLVEIDGPSHSGGMAKEKDRWRSELITAWKVTTSRLTNDAVLNGDFRDIERWLVSEILQVRPVASTAKLKREYERMARSHPDIYQAIGVMTTRRYTPLTH